MGRSVIDEALIHAKVAGLMAGYDARWREQPWTLREKEFQFGLPIVNPATGSGSRSFTQAGKFDGIIVDGAGREFLLEHKTTSDDITDPNAPYWRRLAIDSQVSAYMLAHWQSGRRLHGTVYDVIRKPGIRPKKLTKGDQHAFLAGCRYYGQDFDRQFVLDWSLDPEARETPEMYTARLAAECHENPERYFQRRVIQRLDSEVLEWADELWAVAKDVLEARKSNRHYRNSGACMNFGTACNFLGICSGHDSPDSDRWQKKATVHEEINVEGDGRDVLTHSRVRCFQTCRRKHYYQYELGITRVDDEEREALLLGTAMHAALDSWWNLYSEKRHDDNDTASEAVSVASA